MAGAKLVIYVENVSPGELETREPIGTGQSNSFIYFLYKINRQTRNNPDSNRGQSHWR